MESTENEIYKDALLALKDLYEQYMAAPGDAKFADGVLDTSRADRVIDRAIDAGLCD